MSYPLKSLTPNPERKIPGFCVCDIESFAGWINFAVIGLAWRTYDDNDNTDDENYEHFLTISEFCSRVFEEDQPHEKIFAHFGGKYDFNFILKEYYFNKDTYYIHDIIPRGSGLLCFSVSTIKRTETMEGIESEKVIGKSHDGLILSKNRTISYWDSSAMLPFALASLTENFGVDHKKQEIDYDTITEITPNLLEYLKYDCWGLYEVLERYFRWPLIRSSGAAMTIASQALRVFRTFLDTDIPALRPDVDEFVRKSYFGGRTEIFKPFFEQDTETNMLKSYDVNSLYPAMMRELSMPGGFKFETMFYMKDEIGFYDCEVTVPYMYIPILGVKYEGMDNRLIFPIGTFRGCWSVLELNYAISQGVKINKIYKGMIFHNIGKIFEGYIDSLYKARKESKKDSVDNVLLKLIMNSTYGKFALNLDREQLVFDEGQAGVTPHLEIPLSSDGKEIIRLATKDVYLEDSFANVAIACYVTSGARVHMHKLIMESPEEMYYMDTDSLKTTHTYPCNDSDLGHLKLEYKSKRACFLLPKTYIEETTAPLSKVFDEKGRLRKWEELDAKGNKKHMLSNLKIVMKGFDKKKIGHFTPDDFTSCLEGDMIRLRIMNPKKFATLKTAIRKNDFLVLLKETPRQIRTRYNKRLIVKKPWAQVYDSEPLIIKDGTITNLPLDILKKWKPPKEADLREIERKIELQWGNTK